MQVRLFFDKLLSLLGIERGDDLLDESLISRNGGKVKAAATVESLAQAAFEMPMRCLYRTVLMGDSEVVARRLQTIVSTDLLIQAGQLGVASSSIAVSGTETISAMSLRHPTTSSESIL
ncbi:MAG: hypothetical protein AVDCRST_MAG93-6422 [uncultured Chloroflexia bacterium]|uniref:Uncharacterized protein n=1 Tax=uncultured Chloroflexia bacterium TaxID=1672391 RepID=A0A6J4LMM2_9CHLR|nr:MAG: hypothetical protein AVDCRST_MAG93-6422 [uncultured Chloroflexia bacterium]